MSTAQPPRPDPAAPRASDPTIGRLVADATENISGIVRSEIALAKAEVNVEVKKGVKGGVMFAVAAVFGVIGLLFLLHSAAQGIAQLIQDGIFPWTGYLIVAVVLLILAGIFAAIGLATVKKIKGAPRTIDSMNKSVEAVKRSTSGDETRALRLADPITHGATERTRPGTSPAVAATPASAPATSGSTRVTS
ncbi:MAG: phage holin family protein [Mobilicoccus sp.]|nr:phage holin family protein [Mobilicoccus sp.]